MSICITSQGSIQKSTQRAGQGSADQATHAERTQANPVAPECVAPWRFSHVDLHGCDAGSGSLMASTKDLYARTDGVE